MIPSLLATAPGAVALTAQVTCLLLLALALAWLGRRGSPQTLHLLWTITFGVVLALPLLGVLTPRWNVPILPDVDGALHPPAAEAAAVTPEAAPIVEGQGSAGPRGGAVGGLAVDGATRSSPGIARLLFVAWVLGCAVSLASLAFGALRLRALVRAARPLRDPDWLRRIGVVRKQLRIRGHVRLLTSARVLTPMTGGLWRPVILLPESAAEWGPEQRDIVLTHELIHVRRRDALRQVMRRIVLALYWFHPLSWIASRLATLAGEKACDDAVLALGIRPSDYARHLLVLARGLSAGTRVLALPIVHPSQLESRIVSILDRRRPGASASRTAMTLVVLGAAGVFAAAARPIPIDDAIQESVQCSGAADAAPSMFPLGDGVLFEDWRAGERAIERFVEGMHLCMRESGEVVMSADGTTVQALGAGSWLVLESRAGSVHRLLITRGSGGIEREWSIDGVRRTFDAEARRWRDLMFTVLHGSRDASQIRGEDARLRERISEHRGHVAARRGLVEALEGQVARLARGGALTERQVELLRGRITEIRAEMEAYDLDGKVREARREIDTLDAAARAGEVDRALEDEIAELQRLIG
ncbi:M56 family metallopeptidase [Candidatus Palauibacter sp.]|uniref:M56 family metallopeptidase n=1 Tax=Candidatus Palauibacter sp. TaxID=3101350 RepID=UPI003B021494